MFPWVFAYHTHIPPPHCKETGEKKRNEKERNNSAAPDDDDDGEESREWRRRRRERRTKQIKKPTTFLLSFAREREILTSLAFLPSQPARLDLVLGNQIPNPLMCKYAAVSPIYTVLCALYIVLLVNKDSRYRCANSVRSTPGKKRFSENYLISAHRSTRTSLAIAHLCHPDPLDPDDFRNVDGIQYNRKRFDLKSKAGERASACSLRLLPFFLILFCSLLCWLPS